MKLNLSVKKNLRLIVKFAAHEISNVHTFKLITNKKLRTQILENWKMV